MNPQPSTSANGNMNGVNKATTSQAARVLQKEQCIKVDDEFSSNEDDLRYSYKPAFVKVINDSLSTWLQLCNIDPKTNSNIGTEAFQNIKTMIKGLMYSPYLENILSILFKEIAKNGNARSLIVALSCFGKIVHLSSLETFKLLATSYRAFEAILQREETALLEVLAYSMDRMFQYLIRYATQKETEALITMLIKHLDAKSIVKQSAVIKAICSICLHSSERNSIVKYTFKELVIKSMSNVTTHFETALLQLYGHLIPLLSRDEKNMVHTLCMLLCNDRNVNESVVYSMLQCLHKILLNVKYKKGQFENVEQIIPLLVSNYLSTDSTSSKPAKIKTVALNCIDALSCLWPKLFLIKIENETVWDILAKYGDHSDPKIKGILCLLAAKNIAWRISILNNECLDQQELPNSMNIIGEQLLPYIHLCLNTSDNIANISTFNAIKLLIPALISNELCISFANNLIRLLLILAKSCSESVRKVHLIQLLASIDFIRLRIHCDVSKVQEIVLNDIITKYLYDKDANVRGATSEALVNSVIPNLCFEYYWPNHKVAFTIKSCHDMYLDKKLSYKGNLLVVIQLLYRLIKSAQKNHELHGCCQALSLLCKTYGPKDVPSIWKEANKPGNSTIIEDAMYLLLQRMPSALDFISQKLFFEIVTNLSADTINSDTSNSSKYKQLVDYFGQRIHKYSYQFLCMYSQLAKGINFQGNGVIEDNKDKLGYFCDTAYCLKVFENLKIAYKNHKVSMGTDIFLSMLNTILETISIMISTDTRNKFEKYIDELLEYLNNVFVIAPNSTIKCATQLLATLFGEVKIKQPSLFHTQNTTERFDWYELLFKKGQLYNIRSDVIHEELLQSIQNSRCKLNHFVKGRTAALKSKNSLMSTYSAFKAILVKSIKFCTLTNEENVHCNILRMISLFLRSGINYIVIDNKKVIYEFIMNQLKSIRLGQIRHCSNLLPSIFEFLVILARSNENITSFGKIIEELEELVKSNQPKETHCIPAVRPVVVGLLLLPDSIPNEAYSKRLFLILRDLIAYPEVIQLVAEVLSFSELVPTKQWIRIMATSIFPYLKMEKICIDNIQAVWSLNALFYSFSNTNSYELLNIINIVMVCKTEVTPRYFAISLAALRYIVSLVHNHRSSLDQILFYPGQNLTIEKKQALLARAIFKKLLIGFTMLEDKSYDKEFVTHLLSDYLKQCIFAQTYGDIALMSFKNQVDEFKEIVGNLNEKFFSLKQSCPPLLFQWMYLLNYIDVKPYFDSLWNQSTDIAADSPEIKTTNYKQYKYIYGIMTHLKATGNEKSVINNIHKNFCTNNISIL